MKSVRSPEHQGRAGGGKFRLQYDYAAINVYSQLPRHEEEESQYQDDSFCVGSEGEEGTRARVRACVRVCVTSDWVGVFFSQFAGILIFIRHL